MDSKLSACEASFLDTYSRYVGVLEYIELRAKYHTLESRTTLEQPFIEILIQTKAYLIKLYVQHRTVLLTSPNLTIREGAREVDELVKESEQVHG